MDKIILHYFIKFETKSYVPLPLLKDVDIETQGSTPNTLSIFFSLDFVQKQKEIHKSQVILQTNKIN